jgi:DNA-binding Lrp family transcriptional regulator
VTRREDLIEAYIAASIDEAIREMLGEGVIEAFYVYLNEKGISRGEMPDKLKLFCSALDTTFGVQSNAIQRGIARRLFAKIELHFSPADKQSLNDYVQEARRELRLVGT